eukprot:Hpha_TRINITY_DN15024_c0_g1::TRINITY_DN15024_c0_g1_i1::g.123408::m.123408
MSLPLFLRLGDSLVPIEAEIDATVVTILKEARAAFGAGVVRLTHAGEALTESDALCDTGVSAESTIDCLLGCRLRFIPTWPSFIRKLRSPGMGPREAEGLKLGPSNVPGAPSCLFRLVHPGIRSRAVVGQLVWVGDAEERFGTVYEVGQGGEILKGRPHLMPVDQQREEREGSWDSGTTLEAAFQTLYPEDDEPSFAACWDLITFEMKGVRKDEEEVVEKLENGGLVTFDAEGLFD